MHPMDFDGPAPFVVGDPGGTTFHLCRCARNSKYDTPSSTQHDHTTKGCKHSFPAPISNNLATATNVSDILLKQILVCFKNDIILTTVHHTNDARSATSAAQLAVAYACGVASSFSSGLLMRSYRVVIPMELSMNNRQPSAQFFNPVTRRFSCSESTHAPRGGV